MRLGFSLGGLGLGLGLDNTIHQYDKQSIQTNGKTYFCKTWLIRRDSVWRWFITNIQRFHRDVSHLLIVLILDDRDSLGVREQDLAGCLELLSVEVKLVEDGLFGEDTDKGVSGSSLDTGQMLRVDIDIVKESLLLESPAFFSDLSVLWAL